MISLLSVPDSYRSTQPLEFISYFSIFLSECQYFVSLFKKDMSKMSYLNLSCSLPFIVRNIENSQSQPIMCAV